MTETSRFWDGISVGDATVAPYDAPTEFANVLNSIGGPGSTPANFGGISPSELNGLEVSGTVSPVSVNTGRAIVYGNWYQNDAAVTVVIPTPAGATRIDRIVLRKDWSAQTVRITRIAGAEGGAAPALVQVAGTTWDIPLAQASITTGGVITVTNDLQYIGIPGVVGESHAEVSTVSASSVDLLSIPVVILPGSIVRVVLNFRTIGDTIINHAASIGLKLNATEVLAPTALSTSGTANKSGMVIFEFIYGRANYPKAGLMRYICDVPPAGLGPFIFTTAMPTATLTAIIIRASINNAMTLAIRDVQVILE